MYYYGKGVRKDYGKAVEYYQKAASQGQPDAQYSLGIIDLFKGSRRLCCFDRVFA